MPHLKSIPIVLTGTSGFDLRPLSSSEEETLAKYESEYMITEHPASNLADQAGDVKRNYFGSIDRFQRLKDSDMNNVGSFTDTTYGAPIGTHPGTSINEITTTTPMFQCLDSDGKNEDYNWPSPSINRPMTADSDGDLREMSESRAIEFGKRILEISLTNEYAGSFRVSSSEPNDGGTWELWNEDVYVDNQVVMTSSNYTSIWRKTSTTTTTNPIKVMGLINTFDLQQIADTNDVVGRATRLARINTDLGKMVLLSSSDTPSSIGETGTWQERGTITDHINSVESINYASEFFLSYSNAQFQGDFNGSRSYISFADVPTGFVGNRVLNFNGARSNQQNGEPTTFLGDRTYAAQYGGSREYTASYVGTRPFNGQRFFSVTTGGQFTGSREYSTSYVGQRTAVYYQNFQGPTYFVGPSRTNTNFNGNRTKFVDGLGAFYNQFLSLGSGNFLSPQVQYSGQRFFTGFRKGGGKGGGDQPVFNFPFVGPGKFTGARWFSGSRLNYYSGTRPYAGQRDTPYLGQGPYNGVRYFTANNQPFGGSRFYGSQYVGQRTTTPRVTNEDYAGTRTPAQGGVSGQFGGSRTFNSNYGGDRTYTSQYAGDRFFSATYSRNSQIERQSTVPTEFDNQYSGTYSSQFTGEYVGQNSEQYAGQTITAPVETVEVYTLYVKVSEQ